MTPKAISESTPVRLGLVVTIVGMVVGGIFWQNSQLNAIQHSMDALNFRLEKIETNIQDRWTASHQKIWELEMRQRNPTLNIPNSWDITKQRNDKE